MTHPDYREGQNLVLEELCCYALYLLMKGEQQGNFKELFELFLHNIKRQHDSSPPEKKKGVEETVSKFLDVVASGPRTQFHVGRSYYPTKIPK